MIAKNHKKYNYILSEPRKYLYFLLDAITPLFHPLSNHLKFRLLQTINTRYIQLSLTYKCQCKCRHCGMSRYETTTENTKLKPKLIYRLIDNMVKDNFGQIDFFGGEPLLDNRITDYIHYATKKGIFTHINTNGLLLSRKKVRRLKKAGLSAVSISFDHPEPRMHNYYRQTPFAFSKALKGAEYCIENKIKTIMSIYTTPKELSNGNTGKLIQLARQNNFSHVRLLAPFKTGNLQNSNTDIKTKALIPFLNQIIQDNSFVKPHGIYKCFVPYKSTVYISPYGQVQPCSMVPIEFGNIQNEDLSKILNRMYNHPIYSIKEAGCLMNSKVIRYKILTREILEKSKLPIPSSGLSDPCLKT
jgi:MoaA/NifB/PqqE/SkfB family radical SAM enzyme